MEGDELIGLILIIVGVIICGVGSWFAVSLGSNDLIMGIVVFVMTLIIGGGCFAYGLIMMHPDLQHLRN